MFTDYLKGSRTILASLNYGKQIPRTNLGEIFRVCLNAVIPQRKFTKYKYLIL